MIKIQTFKSCINFTILQQRIGINRKCLVFFTPLRYIAKCVNYLSERNYSENCNHRILYRHQLFNKCGSVRIAERKMHQTKEFSLMDYDIIGFDLDGTLLRYNLTSMTPLIYNILIKYLVDKANYPKGLLNKQFDKDFIQKGLIIDAERGNIVKLSAGGTIVKATHGTKFLSNKQMQQIYGKDCQWSLAQDFIKDPVSIWNGPNSLKIRIVLDYFDFPSILVFAQAVDILDEHLDKQQNNATTIKTDYTVYPDILQGLIHMYARENFANGQSDYFKALKSEPDKYLIRTNCAVLKWLKDLRSSGKILYLLTGSNIDFANFTASYALGTEWRDLFHMISCYAKKPGYFFMNRPFVRTNIRDLSEVPNSEVAINEHLNIGNIYSQGNWSQLRNSLNYHLIHKIDVNKIKSLYLGDNLIQDIYAPTKYSEMNTIAISEELLANNSNYEFTDIVESKVWGSYFNVNNTPTIWAQMINNCAELCIPNLDVLAEISLSNKLLLSSDIMQYSSHDPSTTIV